MSFLEILGAIAVGRAALGVTVKDLVSQLSNQDKSTIESYFVFLEGRRVLTAPFDNEVTVAVINSLEEIKAETEKVRVALKSDYAQHVLLILVTTLSSELMELYRYQGSASDVLFYKVLQNVRSKFAKGLGLLCSAYKIDLMAKQTELAKMVLTHAYQPR